MNSLGFLFASYFPGLELKKKQMNNKRKSSINLETPIRVHKKPEEDQIRGNM